MLWADIERTNGLLDPWKEFERLNRMISGLVSGPRYEFPPVNTWIDTDAAVVTAELPGLEADDIQISVVGKSLTIRGERKAEEAGENDVCYRRERWSGKFSRTIELPFNIQADAVEAKFSRGVLSIRLPRAEAEKPKKIEIKSE
jgi:HSP20 family protein